MQLTIVFALAALAMGRPDECGEEKAEQCVETLMLIGDATKYEVCRVMRITVDCLRDVAEECLNGEQDEEQEEGLQELENLIRDNCPNLLSSQDSYEAAVEKEKCLDENEDYMYECISESSSKAWDLIKAQGGSVNEHSLSCGMYNYMASCSIDRAEEKCGAKVAQLLKDELEDVPEEIQEACDKV